MRATSILLGLAIAIASTPLRGGTAPAAAAAQGTPQETANSNANAEATQPTPLQGEGSANEPSAVICMSHPARYPPESIRRGEQGTVQVRVRVGADGSPLNASVTTSSGFPRLDEAALKAVLHRQFDPVLRDGTRVEGDITVPIEFTIDNGPLTVVDHHDTPASGTAAARKDESPGMNCSGLTLAMPATSQGTRDG